MTSGVIRQSVRSRLPWRMISWPAAKQIRWVNPSMATVSPSRTSSRTASRMVATLPPSGISRRRLPFGVAAQHAELVASGVQHDRPVRAVLLDEPLDGGAGGLETLHLVLHGGR